MRHLVWVCALASFSGAAFAQGPDSSLRRPGIRPPGDSGVLAVPPDCTRKGGGAPDAASKDSLCLTRAETVAAALLRNPQIQNPQIEAVREQVAQARARKVTGTAIPDPAFNFEVDEATGVLGGGAKDKILGASLTIPFPDKFRLNGRIGRADIQSNEAMLALTQLALAAQASETYDSLLAALRHRGNQEEAKRQAEEFLRRTEARFAGGTAARLDPASGMWTTPAPRSTGCSTARSARRSPRPIRWRCRRRFRRSSSSRRRRSPPAPSW